MIFAFPLASISFSCARWLGYFSWVEGQHLSQYIVQYLTNLIDGRMQQRGFSLNVIIVIFCIAKLGATAWTVRFIQSSCAGPTMGSKATTSEQPFSMRCRILLISNLTRMFTAGDITISVSCTCMAQVIEVA
jgi:hypothetical protein